MKTQKNNTKKQSSATKNSNKSAAINTTEKKQTLKSVVMKETLYLLKRNKKGIKYADLINSVLNKYKQGTKNSVHGCIQKARVNENGWLYNLVTVNKGIWSLKSVIFTLFF